MRMCFHVVEFHNFPVKSCSNISSLYIWCVSEATLLKYINYIFNSNSKVRNIEFFLKPRKTGLRSAFHQDNSYWNFSDEKKALNVWIACSESNFKNGGVCYYRKSHKLGLLKHEISYEPGSSQKIPNDWRDKQCRRHLYG